MLKHLLAALLLLCAFAAQSQGQELHAGLVLGRGAGQGMGALTPPSYIAKFEGTTAGGTVTVSGISANDTLVLVGMNDTSTAVTYSSLPSGFTEVKRLFVNSNGANGGTIGVFVKLAAAGGETSVAPPTESTGGGSKWTVYQFRGANNSAEAFTADSAGDNTQRSSPFDTPTSASLTPSVSGSMLLCFAGIDNDTSVPTVSTAFATQSGTTSAWTSVENTSNVAWMRFSMGYATQTSQGAFTVKGTVTLSSSTAAVGIITMGLKGL